MMFGNTSEGGGGSWRHSRRIKRISMMNNLSSDKQAAIKQELDALVKIIAGTVPVEQIYLFGSHVHGTPHNDSDIDLYIVFKDDMQMREIDALVAARVAIAPAQNMPLDLLGQKKSKFLVRSSGLATIEKEITQNGVKLYG
jgi:predicted nucleotidyltransferase